MALQTEDENGPRTAEYNNSLYPRYKKERKNCLYRYFSRSDLAFIKFSKRSKTPTKMSRISELGENKLRTEGMVMRCELVK